MFRKILLALSLCLSVMPGVSQVATGLYNYGSFDSFGFDSINRGSLNVHFAIPIVTKTGRGLPFQYSLDYEGLVWQPSTASGVMTWTPDSSWGLHGQVGDNFQGYVSYKTSTFKCTEQGEEGPERENETLNAGYVYHDPFGESHGLDYSVSQCGDEDPDVVGTGKSVDGSGYTFDGYHTLTLPDGRTIGVPLNTSTGASLIADTNGNSITTNGNGIFNDTTGSAALTVTGAGSVTSASVLTYNTPTGTAAVTVSFKNYTVQTNFGCTSGEYNETAALPYRVTLTDGTFYQFGYELTPGQSGGGTNVTGRLATITLPTLGVISYTYTGTNNGINCADGTPEGLTRTTSDGSRTYVRSSVTSTSSHTDISDGSSPANHSTYDFVTTSTPTAFYETDEANYLGAASGAALQSRTVCYNGSATPCTTTAVSQPISQISTVTTLSNGVASKVVEYFNSLGLVSELDEYDFGASAPIRKTLITHASIGNNINDRPSTVTVQDANQNQLSLTTYHYDEYPTPASNAPGLASVSGSRGNQTSALVWLNTTGATVASHWQYDDAGQVIKSEDAAASVTGQWTTYKYDPTDAFVMTTTVPTPSSGMSLAYTATSDATSGVPLTGTDPNGAQISYKNYDGFLRAQEVDSLDNNSNIIGKTTATYSANQSGFKTYQNSTVYADNETHFDGYGRADRVEVANGQPQNPWYQQDSCFDSNGRLKLLSYSYSGTGFGSPNTCSGSGDTYSYDPLGRVTAITHADGTSIAYTYKGRSTQVIDENGVWRISQVDGLGRMTSVCEVSPNTLQGTAPVNCGQDIDASGFLTSYTYNLATFTTTATQSQQTRIFQTDSLGRAVYVKEPERGITNYTYAYSSTIGLGLTVTRQRPKAGQISSVVTNTTTQYDVLGRVVSVNYDDNITPNKTYYYDANTTWSGLTATNTKGRLAVTAAKLASGASHSGSLYSYDFVGRVVNMWECAPSICGTSSQESRPPLAFGYDWAGNLTSALDGASGNILYGRSQAGEVTSIANQNYPLSNGGSLPASIATNVANSSNGPLSYNFGNGLSQDNSYDLLGRVSGNWVCVGSPSAACTAQRYGFTTTWKGSQLQKVSDDLTGQGTIYHYDEFNRLYSSNFGNGHQTFTYVYDLYGNRWQQSAPRRLDIQPVLRRHHKSNQQWRLYL